MVLINYCMSLLRFASVTVLDVVAVAVAALDVGWFCWLAMEGGVGGTYGRDQTPDAKLFSTKTIV